MICWSRREVLFGLAGFTLFGAAACRGKEGRDGPAPDLSSEKVSPLPVFSKEQLPIIAAAVDTILPGAHEAGVPDYVAYWLSKKPFEGTRHFVIHGLRVLDDDARRRHQQPFSECEGEDREALVRALAEGKGSSRRFDSALFFQKLVELTLEGYLSDPRYGGNRDMAGWRFIGIPDGLRSCWWNPNGVEGVLNNG